MWWRATRRLWPSAGELAGREVSWLPCTQCAAFQLAASEARAIPPTSPAACERGGQPGCACLQQSAPGTWLTCSFFHLPLPTHRSTEDSRDVQINLAANLTGLPLGPRFNGSGISAPMVHEGFLAAATEVFEQVAAALRELDPLGGLPVYSVG